MTIGQAYDTLGLGSSSTTPDEVRWRFRDLIRSNHPDGKPSREQARANETTRVIVEACTLLRTNGFPRLVARNGAADLRAPRYERSAAVEPQSADPFAWLDEVWCECVRSNLVCLVLPAFDSRWTRGRWAGRHCGI